LAQLTVNLDGRGQLFCGRATDWLRDDLRVIFETMPPIAKSSSHLIARIPHP